MTTPVIIPLGLALFIAIVAAICDSRFGTIPNWLTLPPLVGAPVAYGLLLSADVAAQCLAASLLSGIGPYLVFRRGGMGGGDVKLFAALGAVTGFDPIVGVEIELAAFAIAMLVAVSMLAWRGRLLVTVTAAFVAGWSRVTAGGSRVEPREELLTPIRMGGAVLAATAIQLVPYLSFAWSHA